MAEARGREVTLAGRRLWLRYTVNSLCEVEDRSGLPIDRLLDLHFSATRLLLWAGLRRDQPELTVSDVGELIGECLAGGMPLEDIVDLCAAGLRDAGVLREEGLA